MKAIIHDWDDDSCVKILTHCRKAMNPGGKVLIAEQVINDRPDGVFGKLVDLEMLIMTHGGRERTEPEFRALVQRAGLKVERIVPTQSPVCIVECLAA